MAGKIHGEFTLTANSPADEIPLPDLDVPDAAVIYVFHGDHANDVKIVQEEGDSGGLLVPAGKAYTSGPHSIARGPRYLYAASSTSVTVTVQRVE